MSNANNNLVNYRFDEHTHQVVYLPMYKLRHRYFRATTMDLKFCARIDVLTWMIFQVSNHLRRKIACRCVQIYIENVQNMWWGECLRFAQKVLRKCMNRKLNHFVFSPPVSRLKRISLIFRIAEVWWHLLALFPYPSKIIISLENLGHVVNHFSEENNHPCEGYLT